MTPHPLAGLTPDKSTTDRMIAQAQLIAAAMLARKMDMRK